MKILLSFVLGLLLSQLVQAQELIQGVPAVDSPDLVQPRNRDLPAPAANSRHGDRTVVLPQTSVRLSDFSLREIDRYVVDLAELTKLLHDEYHEHFEGIRHVEKLDEDVTELERMAEALHQLAINNDGNAVSAERLRNDTNAFIQHTVRIIRSINLVEPWLRPNLRIGIVHMRAIADEALGCALRIDRYLPVDTKVIDDQTAILESAIKELHDEFHEHLEGYQVSRELDRDLEDLETLVEHMHDLAHHKTWAQLDLAHLLEDVIDVRRETWHIESLFIRQSELGVLTKDWIGIEHSRDAITDVLASDYLLEHMIRKTGQRNPHHQRVVTDRRPLRDRHGHVIQAPRPHYQRTRHNPHYEDRR